MEKIDGEFFGINLKKIRNTVNRSREIQTQQSWFSREINIEFEWYRCVQWKEYEFKYKEPILNIEN